MNDSVANAPRLARAVRRLAGETLGRQIEQVELSLSPSSRRLSGLLGGAVPANKVLVYRNNLSFCRNLDVLVAAEKTFLILKRVYGLNGLKIVHTRHGAGDRAISFDNHSARFDHVLCSGAKIKERLIAEAGVDPASISIVGYPRFDLAAPAIVALPLADFQTTWPATAFRHVCYWHSGRSGST